MPLPVVLASASPARLRLLQAAGIDPLVMVSGVDEDDVDATDPEALVATLARRKADAVIGDGAAGIVVAADSTLVLDGVALGKPHTAEAATARWARMRGRDGELLTGHHVIDTTSGRRGDGVARTTVSFVEATDDEVAAYVATGEPLEVAGAFTLDGYGAAFVSSISGDASNVVGLSLPLLRRLLSDMGIGWTDLWR